VGIFGIPVVRLRKLVNTILFNSTLHKVDVTASQAKVSHPKCGGCSSPVTHYLTSTLKKELNPIYHYKHTRISHPNFSESKPIMYLANTTFTDYTRNTKNRPLKLPCCHSA